MSSSIDLDSRIAQANARFKTARIRVALQRRGGKIVLQATLPPKPGSKTAEWAQQRISLAPATPEGFRLAEREARRIGVGLDFGDFDWTPYLRRSPSSGNQQTASPESSTRTIRDWIEAFESYYFSCRARCPKSQTTWDGDYLASFKKLQGEQLDSDSLLAAVLSTKPDSKTRKRTCMALAALARFAGVKVDLKPYRGKYCSQRVNSRSLPTDQIIVEWRDRIPDANWQWAYGMVATYGIRPHEIWHLEPTLGEPSAILSVVEGKTGGREIWPFLLEWVEQWDLPSFRIPLATGKNNKDLGNRATKYFRRIQLPFTLYDLRHCWARRTLEKGLSPGLAAQQMGHSLTIHSQIYWAWIGKSVHQKAFDSLFC